MSAQLFFYFKNDANFNAAFIYNSNENYISQYNNSCTVSIMSLVFSNMENNALSDDVKIIWVYQTQKFNIYLSVNVYWFP